MEDRELKFGNLHVFLNMNQYHHLIPNQAAYSELSKQNCFTTVELNFFLDEDVLCLIKELKPMKSCGLC